MRDTPETDHLENELGQAARMSHPILWEHSRKLERERDEARDKAERYRLEANAMMMQRDEALEKLSCVWQSLRDLQDEVLRLTFENRELKKTHNE